jgi:hypothetical protein
MAIIKPECPSSNYYYYIRRTPLKEAALTPGLVDAVTSNHAALEEARLV